MKTSILALIASLTLTCSAHAYTVTVDTTLPTNVGLFDDFVGQTGTYFDPIVTSIGTFWGSGVIYPADSENFGVALAPALNGHAYMGVDGDETLDLKTPTTSISILWGSVDDYNTFETAQGPGSVIVMGGDVGGLLPATDTLRAGLVTITNSTPFSEVQFHSLGAAFEFQMAPTGSAPVPEASTYVMMGIGFAGLAYAASKRTRLAARVA